MISSVFKRQFASASLAFAAMYCTEQRGCLYDKSYRLFLKNENGNVISPFHDIPLEAHQNVFNMIVEVPRWSNAKMEISTAEKMNPIKQDIKNGKVRFVANVFPYKGYIWNYGALPQTFEDPNHIDNDTNARGDGDPVDVCEIGTKIHTTGSVVKIKLLGILALIDEGETDWKVIAIDVTDPIANELNSITDIELKMPGLLKATVEWFKLYKIPSGKPPNVFAFDGKIMDTNFCHKIVAESHEQWKQLMLKDADFREIERSSTVHESVFKISANEAQKVLETNLGKGCDKAYDANVHKWYYVADING